MNFIKKSLLALTLMTSIIGGSYTMQDPDIELATAAFNEDVNAIQQAIGYGANINLLFATISLHQAIQDKKIDLVRLLLKNKANITQRDAMGKTPLHCAACNGHVGIVKLLLQNGASTNTQDTFLSSPLHCATFNGYTNVARLLLHYGADATAQDRFDKTPLYYAAQEGHLETLALLIAYDDEDEWKELVKNNLQVRHTINNLRRYLAARRLEWNYQYVQASKLLTISKGGTSFMPAHIAAKIADKRVPAYNERTAQKLGLKDKKMPIFLEKFRNHT